MKKLIIAVMILMSVSVMPIFAETITFEGKKYNAEKVGLHQVYFKIVMDKYNIDSEWLISYYAEKRDDMDKWTDWKENNRSPANGMYLNNSKLERYLSPLIKDEKISFEEGTLFLMVIKKWWDEQGYFNVLYTYYIVRK